MRRRRGGFKRARGCVRAPPTDDAHLDDARTYFHGGGRAVEVIRKESGHAAAAAAYDDDGKGSMSWWQLLQYSCSDCGGGKVVGLGEREGAELKAGGNGNPGNVEECGGFFEVQLPENRMKRVQDLDKKKAEKGGGGGIGFVAWGLVCLLLLSGAMRRLRRMRLGPEAHDAAAGGWREEVWCCYWNIFDANAMHGELAAWFVDHDNAGCA
jgi:hypothetical protein